MTKNEFLDCLCDFTRETLKDLRLPVEMQEEDEAPPLPRPPDVYDMGLPDFSEAEKKAPLIIHQIITAKDRQPPKEAPESTVVVRTVAGVYHPNSQEGPRVLLELFERMRLALLRQVWLADRFQLDTAAGVEYLIYDTQLPPYFAGEMLTTWKLPPVEREVNYYDKETEDHNW